MAAPNIPKNTVTPAAAIKDLAKVIDAQNKKGKQEDLIKKTDEDIRKLEESNSANAQELRDLFGKVLHVLESDDTSRQAKVIAAKQLEELQKMTGTEEENRERADREEQANKFLEVVATKVDHFASAFDNYAAKATKGMGLLGALGALGLLFTDPEKLFKGILWAYDKVISIFKGLEEFLNKLTSGDYGGAWEALMQTISDNWEIFAGFLAVLALKYGGAIIRGVSSVIRGVMRIVDWVGDVGKAIKRGGGFFKTLGGLIGKAFSRIFLPITIIMSIIDTVKGAMSGYEEGGIIGAIKGGLTGLLQGLIGWPLDMLKSAISWILEKFGFESASESLDNFSFSEWIGKVVNVVVDWFASLPDKIIALWESSKAALMGLIDQIKNYDVLGKLKEIYETVSNFILDLVFAPFNLIKKAVAWLLEKMGFDKAAEQLSSIDPKQMVIDMFNKVKSWLMGIFDNLPSMDTIKNAIKGMLPTWLGGSENTDTTAASPAVSQAPSKNWATEPVTANTTDDELRAMAAARSGFFTSSDRVLSGLVQERDRLRVQNSAGPARAPDSGVQSASNVVANARAAAGQGGYGRGGGSPTVVSVNNNGSGGGNTASVSTYNISNNGFPDDMFRGDWVQPIAP